MLITVVLAMAAAGILIRFWPRTPPRLRDTATVVRQIQTLSQWVTVQYVVEKVVVLEDVRWYGDNRVLLVAHGIVKAGIDLSKVKASSIRITDQKITLILPPAAVTDTYLDDRHTQVIERTTGLLRTFDKDLEQTARRQAVDTLTRAAYDDGIIKEAEDRAKAQLALFLYQLGFTSVEFKQESHPFELQEKKG